MKKIYYLIGIILIVTISGCTDKLGSIDWSGQISLVQQSNDWAYRNIASAQVHPFSVKTTSKLGEFQKDLLLEKVVRIGNGDYLFKSQFDNDKLTTGNNIIDTMLKTDQFTVYGAFSVETLDISSKRKMELIKAKEYEAGDPWKTNIDDPKSDRPTIIVERKGDFSYYFKEPSLQQNFVLSASYNIKSNVERKTDNNGKLIKSDNNFVYGDVYVTGSSSMNIGLCQCLLGTKTVNKQKIKFYVLDWNLDGQFTEDDMVWSDYTNKNYEFNQPIRLTGSWNVNKDNTYQLKLLNPKSEKEPYILDIKLVSKGKR